MTNWKFWLGVAISALCLFLAIRKVDFSEFVAALQAVNYLYVVPIVLLTLLSFLFRAYRWRWLLAPIKEIKVHSLFSSTMIGFMANNLLPARMGEFVRAYSIGRKEAISKSSALATIVVERVFDLFILLSFLGIGSLFADLPSWASRSGYVVLGLNTVVLAGLLSFERWPERMTRVVKFVLRPLPNRFSIKILNAVSLFADGLASLRKVDYLFIIFALSVLIWMTYAVMNQLVLDAFGLDLPLSAPFLVLAFTALGVMIPSSPGYVGTFQLLFVAGLTLYGVGKESALGASVVLHVSQVVPVTAIGLVYLGVENFSLRSGREAAVFQEKIKITKQPIYTSNGKEE